MIEYIVGGGIKTVNRIAALQTQAGDPQAGLSEEERAGRNGQLAAPPTGPTQTFRPVALDLNGDGVTSYEDIETIISGADLKANDAIWLDQAA